jgi:hypothetical protein
MELLMRKKRRKGRRSVEVRKVKKDHQRKGEAKHFTCGTKT